MHIMLEPNVLMNDHLKSLFCNTRYRVDGKCDAVRHKIKYFDFIDEYEWTGANLNCIECVTMIMYSGARYCWDWGLN